MQQRHPIPKKHVAKKYHREGFVDGLDGFKAEAVLTSPVQRRAEKLLGPGWRSYKPSALLKMLGLVVPTS